jgi:hypothetical protein
LFQEGGGPPLPFLQQAQEKMGGLHVRSICVASQLLGRFKGTRDGRREVREYQLVTLGLRGTLLHVTAVLLG